MLWMMMISLAFAAPCEWSMQPQRVDTTRSTITIDGTTYKAKEVARQLRDCDEDEAAEAVELWQTKRKLAEAALVVSVLGMVAPPIGIPMLGGALLLVRGARKDRERAVVLIDEGRALQEAARPESPPSRGARAPTPTPTDDPADEPLDPSTFDDAYEE